MDARKGKGQLSEGEGPQRLERSGKLCRYALLHTSKFYYSFAASEDLLGEQLNDNDRGDQPLGLVRERVPR